MSTKHYGYGRFCGGDPRDFTPDRDCSTDAELLQHDMDCEKWNQADRDGIKLPPETSSRVRLPSGSVVIIHKYGLGGYVYEDDEES